jgi:hypothetical protein
MMSDIIIYQNQESNIRLMLDLRKNLFGLHKLLR